MEICGIKVFQELIFEPLLNETGGQCEKDDATSEKGGGGDEENCS